MERTYSSRDEQLEANLQRGKNWLMGGLVLAGFAGITILDRKADINVYDQVAAEVNSIPYFESTHNYREAEKLENEAWHYLAEQKKDPSFWISKDKIDSLVARLNSNNTIGAERGQPIN